MRVSETVLPGVLLLEPDIYADDRGHFLELRGAAHREAGVPERFAQTNFSRSRRGVLRGLHYQEPRGQGKLVCAVRGTVFDVAVDVRRGSETFGRWAGVFLYDQRQLWVPPGFAHGFYVLGESADVLYECTEPYLPEAQRSVRWDDPAVGVRWPTSGEVPILSEKDASAPLLSDARPLPEYSASLSGPPKRTAPW